jgi:predicted RNase H-like HicB family nuclease
MIRRKRAPSPPSKQAKLRFGRRLPVFVEKGLDGYYVVECPLFEGCYSQGKTIDEALCNIREVVDLILQEREAQELLEAYSPEEISLHTIAV